MANMVHKKANNGKINKIRGLAVGKKTAYRLFTTLIKPFTGKGLGRIRPLAKIYIWIMLKLVPSSQSRTRTVRINGYSLQVGLGDVDGIGQQILFYGHYEPDATKFISLCIKEGMTFVDVGANIGYYTMLASKLVGETGKVWAFEPEPKNYKLLDSAIRLNGATNINHFQYAVCDKVGVTQLFVDKYESGAHGIVKARDTQEWSIEVPSVTLDSVIDRADVMKVDVEGAEPLVLMGSKKILKNKDLVLMIEFWLPGLNASGWDGQNFWNVLENRFRYIYLVNQDSHKLEPCTFNWIMYYCKETFLRKPTSVNLICSGHSL